MIHILCENMNVSKHHQLLCFSFPGSFEIEINGQLIFSKLETSGFPYEDDVSKYLDYGCYPKSL
uniref:Uncharacterized protein n=1 Tax=Sinocyclocheilus grahami TaxID=75366 RepID=A0A672K0L9_SINGR